MKKIALVSCYFKHNYGSMLQAYALQQKLLMNNIPCENINISKLKDFDKGKKKYYKQQITNFKFIKTKIGMVKTKLRIKLIPDKLSNNIKLRDMKFDLFEKENFYLSRKYNTYEELKNMAAERYSDFIVGSDQLWLPVNVVADFYTLNFVPDNINKVSYSTSFGISNIPNRYLGLYKKFLTRIDKLSVREQSGVELIKDKFNITAKLVCDPTMLLTKDEWLSKINLNRRYKEKYIFCYFLGKNKKNREMVKRLANTLGYKIVSINHCDEIDKYADKFADYTPYDVDPFDWVNLLYNSELVCTDSFHGTVFSIINNKNFFVFNRHNDNNKMSTNSRIISILNLFNLQNHLINNYDNINELLKIKTDFNKINQTLDQFRDESINFLLSSLTYSKENITKIDSLPKYQCTGCNACQESCPTKAITMTSDSEGFSYPKINQSLCVNCKKCANVCPIITPRKKTNEIQKTYLIQSKDVE